MKSKIVLNVVLLLAAVGLAISTYNSIMAPIEFNNAFEERDAVVKKRLIDIKEAQKLYADSHNGRYAPNIDTLENFIKYGSFPVVNRVYEFTQKQTDELRQIKKRRDNLASIEEVNMDNNDYDELFMIIRDGYKKESEKGYKGPKTYTEDYMRLKERSDFTTKYTLEDFARDTTRIPVTVKLKEARPTVDIDSMFYIPFTDNKKFLIEINSDGTRFQATADFEDFLHGINDRELNMFLLEKKKEATQIRKKYKYHADGVSRMRTKNGDKEEDMFDPIPCRKIGDVEKSNNNAGNWE